MFEPAGRRLSHLAFLWPAVAAASASEFTAALAKQWAEFATDDGSAPATEPAWSTPNRIALHLNSVRLRDFSTTQKGTPTLLCAPFALHGATVTDVAHGHSLVATLQAAGLERLFVTDWRSATPEMRFLAIDDYLATLNVLVDELGGTADLVGLCQGGWLSLLYAARFPAKVRKLVIVGAPIDIAAAPSDLSMMVDANPLTAFRELINLGDGRVLGERVLKVWNSKPTIADVRRLLQTALPVDSAEFVALLTLFRRWHDWTVNLPGVYYLEVIDKLFRQNALARGRFVALGQTVDLSRVKKPLYLLAASDDELVPPQQLFASARLIGTPADQIVTVTAPCRHLSLFMGKDVLDRDWPNIARWLRSEVGAKGTRARATH